MCDAACQPADRFHLLRLAQLLLEPLAVGHVAAGREDVLRLPVRSGDHAGDRVEEDPAPVGVAHTDSGRGERPLHCLREHLLGAAKVVGVDESREVGADHVLRLDAERFVGGGRHDDDRALEVDDADQVGRAIDDLAVQLFALLQRAVDRAFSSASEASCANRSTSATAQARRSPGSWYARPITPMTSPAARSGTPTVRRKHLG